jgi:hypothetical protein
MMAIVGERTCLGWRFAVKQDRMRIFIFGPQYQKTNEHRRPMISHLDHTAIKGLGENLKRDPSPTQARSESEGRQGEKVANAAT